VDDHRPAHRRVDGRETEIQLARFGRDRQGLCDQAAPSRDLVLVSSPRWSDDSQAGMCERDQATWPKPEQELGTLRTLAVQVDSDVRRGPRPFDVLEAGHRQYPVRGVSERDEGRKRCGGAEHQLMLGERPAHRTQRRYAGQQVAQT